MVTQWHMWHMWDLEISTLDMQRGVTKSSVTKSVLERAALSEGKEIGSNAFTAEVSKKSNLSLPKNSPDRFQGKKKSRFFCKNLNFPPIFRVYFILPNAPWPQAPPGMTRPTALRSWAAGTGATAAALGCCRPKTIFASFVAKIWIQKKTRFYRNLCESITKKRVKALGWMDSELSIPSVFEVLQPGEEKNTNSWLKLFSTSFSILPIWS